MHSSPHSIHGRAGIHWMRHKKSEKWVFGKKCSRARFGMKAPDEQPLNIETLFVSKPHSACTAHQFAKNTYPVDFWCFCVCICICICMSKLLINLQGIHFVTDLQFFSHIIIMCWVFHEKNQSIKVNLFLFALLNWCVRLRLWLPPPPLSCKKNCLST